MDLRHDGTLWSQTAWPWAALAAMGLCAALAGDLMAAEPPSVEVQLSQPPPATLQGPAPAAPPSGPAATGLLQPLEAHATSLAYPTSYEQYLLELVNRARANPVAEAARYGIDLNEGLPFGTITTDPKQPVAFNLNLIAASQQHSQWMIDTDTFSHTGAGGSDPDDRMLAAGYVFEYPGYGWGWAENLALYRAKPSVPPLTPTVAELHRLLFVDAGIAERGHRTNLMLSWVKEIGVGVRTGDWGGWNAVDATEDFALAGGFIFLTGVAYDDRLVTQDAFYTPGEGLAGVTVTAIRLSDNAQASATTWASGGYTLALPPGTYRVTGSGGGLGGPVVYGSVVMVGENVKRDFTPPPAIPITAAFGPDQNWVYQNAPSATGGRHLSVLTISVTSDANGNSSYSAMVTRNSSSSGQVVIEPTNHPLVWSIRGGQHGLDPVGPVTLDITVTGWDKGGQGTTTAQVTVYQLGDIDKDGSVTEGDRTVLKEWLNGLYSGPRTLRDFDLDGDEAVTGADRVLLNRILNGLPIP
jgi:hypothetical protein